MSALEFRAAVPCSDVPAMLVHRRAGSAAVWPVVARAQQPAMPVIGFLSSQTADAEYKHVITPFLRGLKEIGYIDGQNVAVVYRHAENQYDRLPALAAELPVQ